APRVIRMRVREHNRPWMQPLKFPEPIEATIDHHIRGAIRDHQRGMHTMASRARVDLAAGAKKRQFHRIRSFSFVVGANAVASTNSLKKGVNVMAKNTDEDHRKGSVKERTQVENP